MKLKCKLAYLKEQIKLYNELPKNKYKNTNLDTYDLLGKTRLGF